MIDSPCKLIHFRRTCFLLLIFGCLSLTSVRAQTPSVMVTLVDQTQYEGAISECSIDILSLQTETGEKKLAIEEVELVRFQESAPVSADGSARLRLLDYSEIVATSPAIEGKRLVGKFGFGSKSKFLKRNVRSIVFDRGQEYDNLVRQVDTVLADRSIAADTLIVFRKGEFNAIEGVVKNLNADRVEFSIGDQTAEVALAKVSAITFFKAGAAEAIEDRFSTPLATCELVDGSLLRLSRFAVSDKKIEAVALCGERFSLEYENVLSLNFKMTTSVPISELTPTTNDWSPLVTTASVIEPLRQLRLARFDKSFSGNPIALDVVRPAEEVARGKTATFAKSFDSGIAIHGGGRIAWRLGGNYNRLRGTIGFSPAASPLGSVKFRVLVDGQLQVEQELRKSKMNGPIDFEVEIEGRQRLVFAVDYADGNSIGDIVHLVDVVLEK